MPSDRRSCAFRSNGNARPLPIAAGKSPAMEERRERESGEWEEDGTTESLGTPLPCHAGRPFTPHSQALKASTIDGRRKGACLFCQEYFMDLYLLAELKTISLKVTTVDMLKPPPDFRSNFEATPPPILIDNGLAVLENDKIERHIMKNIPGGHNLFVQDKDVAQRTENVYSRFKLMLLKRDDTSKNTLLSLLRKINDHLGERGTRFLTGDTMCCFDCELMPKLQHIRVAGKYFADFEIPDELEHLWRYMYHMYQLDAFTQSCPADQDIINHYKQQQGTRMKKHEELETPTFTTSIPASVRP
ncbi:chloride intracellular channel exc-4-like [Penaeus monodon]|uniref:chloride intracellular channel exc-4-like n=1 Tax=Penaeus monodon TaxID=6687 RepID=UPI0018A77CFE|nr:chloride intracellular channel exc-4-like [Penaeus monodon]